MSNFFNNSEFDDEEASGNVPLFQTALKCMRCRSVFEMALAVPPCPSDTQVEAVCGRCSRESHGVGEFRHLHKSWVCLTATAMHNLTRVHAMRQTHFRISQDIVPYLLRHWDVLCVGRTRHRTLANTISSAITTSLYAFSPKHGAGSGVWGLKDNGELAFAKRSRGPKLRSVPTATTTATATTTTTTTTSASPDLDSVSPSSTRLPQLAVQPQRLSVSAGQALTKRPRQADAAASSRSVTLRTISAPSALRNDGLDDDEDDDDNDVDINDDIGDDAVAAAAAAAAVAPAVREVFQLAAAGSPPVRVGSIELSPLDTIGDLRQNLAKTCAVPAAAITLLKLNSEFPDGVPVWSAQDQYSVLKFWRSSIDCVGFRRRE